MNKHGIEGMLITKPENRHYFSGFSGSAGTLLISDHESKLLTDFRYIEQAAAQAKQCEILRYTASPYELLADTAVKLGLTRIGFESDFVTYDMYTKLTEGMSTIHLLPVQIDELRMMKDENEVASIKKAVEIADSAFVHILSFIKPGICEQTVALELEYQMRKLGAEKPAFDTIVASGKRGALPHGIASEKIIELGFLVHNADLP